MMPEIKTVYDTSVLSKTDLAEIASYIKRDNLEYVNSKVEKVKPKDTFYTRYGKRGIDIALSLIALIITLPINLIIAIVTIFDVGFPIIFKQIRVGKNQKLFKIYKFRNMTNEIDANGELLPTSKRVTKWGRFVRKTSFDELLNFVSILSGSMSIIGPRPLLDYYVERLNDRHKCIFLVRPGLECPTIRKMNHTLSWQERLDNYVWYIENCSLLVDIKLAFRLLEIAFDRKSTVIRSNAANGGLLGYDRDGNVIYTKKVPAKYVKEFCEKHGYGDLNEAVTARGPLI